MFKMEKNRFTDIRVHIGAHKTATTHLQDTLTLLKAELFKKGISYLPREEYRSNIARLMPFGVDRLKYALSVGPLKSSLIDKNLLQTNKYKPILLISEENIMGGPAEVCAAKPYPNMEKRLDFLSHISKQHNVTLFMSIRSFDRLLPGAYVTGLKFDPIFAIRSKQRLLASFEQGAMPSWVDLIDRIRNRIPSCKIHIWTQEKYQDNSAQIIRSFAGTNIQNIPTLPPPPKTITPSYKAISKVEDLLLGLNKKPTDWKNIIERLYTEMRAEEESDKFTFLNSIQIAALQRQYQKDLRELEKSLLIN